MKELEIATLKVEPGDVIVLRCEEEVNMEQVGAWKHDLSLTFPDNKNMVLGPGMWLGVMKA